MKWNHEREEPVAPAVLPSDMSKHVEGRSWFRNRVGQAGAFVHRLAMSDADDLYLKHGRDIVADEIDAEANRLRWVAPHFASAAVVHFSRMDDEAWLLSTAVRGRTAHELMASEPSQALAIVEMIAAFLRRIHAIPASLCPFDSSLDLRLDQARLRMEAGLVDVEVSTTLTKAGPLDKSGTK